MSLQYQYKASCFPSVLIQRVVRSFAFFFQTKQELNEQAAIAEKAEHRNVSGSRCMCCQHLFQPTHIGKSFGTSSWYYFSNCVY